MSQICSSSRNERNTAWKYRVSSSAAVTMHAAQVLRRGRGAMRRGAVHHQAAATAQHVLLPEKSIQLTY